MERSFEKGAIIDQIWYTWSHVGLGITTGFRVRAASASLSNLQSIRFQSIRSHLHYQLPRGVDPYIPLDDAPICLALSNTEREHVLVHKVYTGRDVVGRPGIFFVHLLAGLPEDFSARDAIRLWKSPIWQTHDLQLEQQSTVLPIISSNELYTWIDESHHVFDFGDLQNHLSLLITAFLSISQPQQQLYLIGSSEQIAALIWGLTHCIPQSMLTGLTFSTYEYDPSKSNQRLVGTLSRDVLRLNKNDPPIVIDCNEPIHDRSKDEPYVGLFASFVVQCLLDNNLSQSMTMNKLNELVKTAENEKIANTLDLMNFFRQFLLP